MKPLDACGDVVAEPDEVVLQRPHRGTGVPQAAVQPPRLGAELADLVDEAEQVLALVLESLSCQFASGGCLVSG